MYTARGGKLASLYRVESLGLREGKLTSIGTNLGPSTNPNRYSYYRRRRRARPS